MKRSIIALAVAISTALTGVGMQASNFTAAASEITMSEGVNLDTLAALTDALNDYRESLGLDPVVEDAVLDDEAQEWAEELARTGKQDHDPYLFSRMY